MEAINKSNNQYTIVGAPFGIGKTSLSKFIASIYAERYLDDPDLEDNYIPIFAPLKFHSSYHDIFYYSDIEELYNVYMY
jgi:predicted NACHT family NTPase